ncbi:PotD/PotF family extracellular solute-binding protein [Hyphomicrobium sp. MC8b]|uniref:ABC transporter substrate-binding protein n=1 Tax=Hyphomicrobium sp. MC8b TaxID=300273 RepID=UPI00391C10A6
MTSKKADKSEACPNQDRRRVLQGAGKAVIGGAALAVMPRIMGAASPATAQTSFTGESMIVATWSGNYDRLFREAIIKPFNAQYGTKLDTVGIWDQSVSQIVAAPADNPPFDVVIAEEALSAQGLAEKIYLEAHHEKLPNLERVHPWFYEQRTPHAKPFGVPFGGGNLAILTNKSLGLEPASWRDFWRPEVQRKITLDSAGWWFTLAIAAMVSDKRADVQELYDPTQSEALFEDLDHLKVAKWYKDGAEQTYLMLEEEALMAMVYTTDALALVNKAGNRFSLTAAKEGAPGWTDWFFKVRGTHHADLADLFLNYILSVEVQNRFLQGSLQFVSRPDVTVPQHWNDYPHTSDDFNRKIKLLTIGGWDKLLANWEALDRRFKETVIRTSQSR